jgi:hypothetical protein
MMIITTSAATYFRFSGSQSVETLMKTPMTSEPTRAPNAVPRPPRVTAANTSSRIDAPVSHRSDW